MAICGDIIDIFNLSNLYTWKDFPQLTVKKCSVPNYKSKVTRIPNVLRHPGIGSDIYPTDLNG